MNCILNVTDREFDKILQMNHDSLVWNPSDRELLRHLRPLLGTQTVSELSQYDECRMHKRADLAGLPRIEPASSAEGPSTGAGDVLTPALARLRRAVEASQTSKRSWARTVAGLLADVDAAFRDRRAAAKATNAIATDVDKISPTVVRQADDIRSDHDELLGRILAIRDELRWTLSTGSDSVKFASLRGRILELLQNLEQNQAAASALLQETVNTDIGVGD